MSDSPYYRKHPLVYIRLIISNIMKLVYTLVSFNCITYLKLYLVASRTKKYTELSNIGSSFTSTGFIGQLLKSINVNIIHIECGLKLFENINSHDYRNMNTVIYYQCYFYTAIRDTVRLYVNPFCDISKLQFIRCVPRFKLEGDKRMNNKVIIK